MNESDEVNPNKSEQSSSSEQKITAVDEAGRPLFQSAADDDPLIGQLFSQKYRVLSKLGRGGMSSVYKAIDVFLNRVVALKILLPSLMLDMNGILRFQQEARSASRLNNPHIIKIYEFSVPSDGGPPFLVMDYIDGVTLSDLIAREGAINVDRCSALFMQTCDGLMHAHDNGVIHRDLKPSNIMITQSSFGEDFVNIVDFGIAKMIFDSEAAQMHLTQTGEVFGSPYYMSPEQCRGEKLDGRSDIYALGCVMYECLTGKPPFRANNVFQTMQKHTNEQPQPLAQVRPGIEIPVEVEAIVLKSLSKSPDDRYQSMHELYADLKASADARALVQLTTASHAQRMATGSNAVSQAKETDTATGLAPHGSPAALDRTTPEPAAENEAASSLGAPWQSESKPSASVLAIPSAEPESGSVAAQSHPPTSRASAGNENQDSGLQNKSLSAPGNSSADALNKSAPSPTVPVSLKVLIASATALCAIIAVAGYCFVMSPVGSLSIARYLARWQRSVEKLESVGNWLEGRNQFESAVICYLAAANSAKEPQVIFKELRQSIKALMQLKSTANKVDLNDVLNSVSLATAPGTAEVVRELCAMSAAQNNAKRYAASEVTCRLAMAILAAAPPLQSPQVVHRILSELQECYLNRSLYDDMFNNFGSIRATLDKILMDKEPLAFCLWTQATAKFELNDHVSAQPLYREATSTLQQSGGGSSEEMAAILYDQGQNLIKLNREAQAVQCFQSSLSICEKLKLKDKDAAIRLILAQIQGDEVTPADQHESARRVIKRRSSNERHGLSRIFSKAKRWFGL